MRKQSFFTTVQSKFCFVMALCCIILTNANAQSKIWNIGTHNVTNGPSSVSSAPTPVSASGSNYVSDAVYDAFGSAKFYINNYAIYSSSGTYVGTLPGYYDPGFGCDALYSPSGCSSYNSFDDYYANSSLGNGGLMIVPIPGTCSQYYVIYTLGTRQGGNSLLYITVDASGSSPVLGAITTSAICTLSTGGTGMGCPISTEYITNQQATLITVLTGSEGANSGFTVSQKIDVSGDRYLFTADFGGGVNRYEITSSGISPSSVVNLVSRTNSIFTGGPTSLYRVC